uniref:Uncharacterized protein n=1 Tax=Knipowitschia caucasica TaxID=637954 RepID=A0AAV2JTS0_KNICA
MQWEILLLTGGGGPGLEQRGFLIDSRSRKDGVELRGDGSFLRVWGRFDPDRCDAAIDPDLTKLQRYFCIFFFNNCTKVGLCPGCRCGGMGAAGWEEGEFEFKLVFEEDQNHRASPVCVAGQESARPGEEREGAPEPLETTNHGQLDSFLTFSSV